ncbi:hypothetical protein A1O7_09168, partial [Cladophialophora yegresii CBS 114405]
FSLSLFALHISRKLLEASEKAQYLRLPTSFQMSLLVGILVASAQQLRSYLWYLVRARRVSSISPLLHCVASMMLLSFFLARGVFIADTVLHYTTSTIEFDQILIPPQPVQELGRGLSEFCLKFNRTNLGLPCSVGQDATQTDPNAISEMMETSRLLHDTSQVSQIQITSVDELSQARLSYLMLEQQTISLNTDYNASTLGIPTNC